MPKKFESHSDADVKYIGATYISKKIEMQENDSTVFTQSEDYNIIDQNRIAQVMTCLNSFSYRLTVFQHEKEKRGDVLYLDLYLDKNLPEVLYSLSFFENSLYFELDGKTYKILSINQTELLEQLIDILNT